MAGVVNTCDKCGQTLWDEETIPGNHRCLPTTETALKKTLVEFSDFELEAEVERRKVIAQEVERQREIAQAKRYLELTSHMLEIVQHSCTTCSDNKPINAYQARCARCFVLEAHKSQHWEQSYHPQLIIKQRVANPY